MLFRSGVVSESLVSLILELWNICNLIVAAALLFWMESYDLLRTAFFFETKVDLVNIFFDTPSGPVMQGKVLISSNSGVKLLFHIKSFLP